MKLLLDEVYPPALAERLRGEGVEAAMVSGLGLAGRSDAEVFAVAVEQGYTLLTENAADFTIIAAEQLNAGRHHPGVLIALSSRFSRRSAGIAPLSAAIHAVATEQLADRVLYLERVEGD
ncbi:MAG: DUF5615 family PIN-like protein [Solirubrobacteraceae bacterium]